MSSEAHRRRAVAVLAALAVAVLAALAVAPFVVGGADARAVARTPAVTALSSPPATVFAGTSFWVRDVTRNQGSARARRTTVVYLLARGERPLPSDVVVAMRRVAPLRPRRASRGHAVATVPAGTAPGTYRLVACTGAVPQRSCRAAAGSVDVVSPAPAPVVAPSLAGTPAPDQALHAVPGEWRGLAPFQFSYQWRRCLPPGTACSDIAGATGASYTPTRGDVGSSLSVAVTAANGTGSVAAQSAPAAVRLLNPVVPDDAADPYVLDVGGRHDDYWEFNTGDRFPIRHSTDLVHWSLPGTAFAERPAWVVSAGEWHPWAPSVTESAGPCPGAAAGPCYVMYYVGLSSTYWVNCVAVATASAPGGPYVDRGPLAEAGASGDPVGCQDAAGRGNIDPSPFVDADGHAYLYLSTDFALAGGQHLEPTVSVIPLAADRLSASGNRTPLFAGDSGTWEEAPGVSAPTVEGPTVLRHGGLYYLLYSGGNWRGAYAMGYATATSPNGPFTKARANPILAEAGTVLSPGGGDQPVTGPGGATWLVYHGRASSYGGPRTLRMDRFSWQPDPGGGPDVPTVAGPTAGPLDGLP